MDRITQIAQKAFIPDRVQFIFESLLESITIREIEACPDSFLHNLGTLLTVSPPMLDTLRLHPEYLGWLNGQVRLFGENPDAFSGPDEESYYDENWRDWERESGAGMDRFENLRAFKRREYLFISFMDISGLFSFHETVARLSVLAEWIVQTTLDICREKLESEEAERSGLEMPDGGFAVIAMGKLGGRELNYSSDIDLIFCRRNPTETKEADFFSKLGERMVRTLSKVGQEGFLYRVDMRLRPHGSTGPLVPTIDSLMNYYESWGEPWERQALIKARFIAGCPEEGDRFQHFVRSFTFSRQLEEAALEDVKRVKHRAEKEYAVDSGIHLKQGPGGIRDIEFYTQFSQLTIGWKYPEVRLENTLEAIEALARMKVLFQDEESILSLAYIFLRIAEHRLQLRALTPQAILPDSSEETELLARGLGFGEYTGSPGNNFREILIRYRSKVRSILERVYLAPGYLRLHEREEELAQLLSERMPKERAHELLSQYGFRDINKAWQNIRLLALGPEGRLLPPGERRAFLEFAFPMLEVLGETVDPDQALNNLEDFATSTGNRISFLRTLASRRPHLSRLTNLLALSNRCRQILSRHPEYFDSLARGYYLHEGRQEGEMLSELMDRVGASPLGEERENVLRKYRKREMVRIAYRDLAGLADSLEISRELSDLASACLKAAVDWTRLPQMNPTEEREERLRLIAMGKLGSRQLHYASDLDLIFLYEPAHESDPERRARLQMYQEERIEQILELFAGITPEGLAYEIDLRLRPEGASGILVRSWDSFFEYAKKYMQPWERMALVRSRILDDSSELVEQWNACLSTVVYEYDWDETAFESIRHLKRRIEKEKSRETKSNIDFKYGKGGIADIEFLVQFLQIKHGRRNPDIRVPGLRDAVDGLCNAGVLTETEKNTLVSAHRFERLVENRYQLMEEWASREISRKSPLLVRLAGSLGYRGEHASVRKSFISDWEEAAKSVRNLVEKYFYQ
jgi:glutamate-ammonia-ligase adenylyltransferase